MNGSGQQPPAGRLLACHDCDALYHVRPPARGVRTLCARCGRELARGRGETLGRTAAYALTGLICFVIANVNPVLGLDAGGRIQESTLLSGVGALYAEGMWILALLVLCTSMLFPLLSLLGILAVALGLKWRRQGRRIAGLFRLLLSLLPWSMVGVYMLGVLVAVVKLADLATVIPGLGLFGITALILAMAAMESTLDPDAVWSRLEWRR